MVVGFFVPSFAIYSERQIVAVAVSAVALPAIVAAPPLALDSRPARRTRDWEQPVWQEHD